MEFLTLIAFVVSMTMAAVPNFFDSEAGSKLDAVVIICLTLFTALVTHEYFELAKTCAVGG